MYIFLVTNIIIRLQSEWDTWQNIDAFKQEVEALYKKGIDAEEDPDEKQKLEEARDERISFLEEKIQKLCFWHDVKDGNIGTSKEGAELRIFPKDSNVYHFHPIAFVEQMKRIIGKEDIDLSDPDKWMSQWTQPNPSEACWRTSVLVLKKYGVDGGGSGIEVKTKKYSNGTSYYSNTIQMVIQMKDGSLEATGREQEGIDYIDNQLENGCPIVVGVDDERNETYNFDNTTEHFFVITGRLTDEKGLYYRFFEVGTNVVNKDEWGVSVNNKLYINERNMLIGKKRNVRPNRTYTVTHIRKNN